MVSTQTDMLARAEAVEVNHKVVSSTILATSDHKTIGRLFISSSLFVLLAGLLAGVLVSYEVLDFSSLAIVENDNQFYQWLSFAREIMIFAGVVPLMTGLALYIVPLQIGARTIAFARGAATAFWVWLLGVLLVIVSYVLGGGAGGRSEDFVLLWALAMSMLLAGLIWAMVCVVTTILGARTTGMTLDKMPPSSWGFLVFSVTGILALPVIISELVFSYARVKFGDLDPQASESLISFISPLLVAPFVFWLASPLIGVATDVISVHTKSDLPNNKIILSAMSLFAILTLVTGFTAFGITVESYETTLMLTLGLLLMAAALLVAQAGSLISVIKGEKSLSPPLIGVGISGALLMLGLGVAIVDTLGSATNFIDKDLINIDPLSLRSVTIDAETGLSHQPVGAIYFGPVFSLVVASALVLIISALVHWSTKIWGRQINSFFGFLAIISVSGGGFIWAAGQIISSLRSEPVAANAAVEDSFNLISLAGIIGVFAGICLTILAIAALFSTKISGSGVDKWSGQTLEWATASPPIASNFVDKPIVKSLMPLKQEGLYDAGDSLETETEQDD